LSERIARFIALHKGCREPRKTIFLRKEIDFFLDTLFLYFYTLCNCNKCVAAKGRIETMATKKAAAKKPAAKKAVKKAAPKKK
jgi:hypothetical protein